MLALDEVYTRAEDQKHEFHELPNPEDDEIVEFPTSSRREFSRPGHHLLATVVASA